MSLLKPVFNQATIVTCIAANALVFLKATEALMNELLLFGVTRKEWQQKNFVSQVMEDEEESAHQKASQNLDALRKSPQNPRKMSPTWLIPLEHGERSSGQGSKL
ncbi:hypothetical protein H920_07468 [Fukomys damarensis]|uniref:Uncharacterized protein n=1 Tax=Fukomys damarensis TaxID=885580 RepID=A0A091DGB7_FUKDA|nr:hypothetical protein H920_07468 [Fukomys damarensis]